MSDRVTVDDCDLGWPFKSPSILIQQVKVMRDEVLELRAAALSAQRLADSYRQSLHEVAESLFGKNPEAGYPIEWILPAIKRLKQEAAYGLDVVTAIENAQGDRETLKVPKGWVASVEERLAILEGGVQP